MNEAKLYTVSEAAKKLSVSAYTVRKWLRERAINGFKVGGDKARWHIPEEQINKLLMNCNSKEV